MYCIELSFIAEHCIELHSNKNIPFMQTQFDWLTGYYCLISVCTASYCNTYHCTAFRHIFSLYQCDLSELQKCATFDSTLVCAALMWVKINCRAWVWVWLDRDAWVAKSKEEVTSPLFIITLHITWTFCQAAVPPCWIFKDWPWCVAIPRKGE